jgi:hypothetical protein
VRISSLVMSARHLDMDDDGIRLDLFDDAFFAGPVDKDSVSWSQHQRLLKSESARAWRTIEIVASLVYGSPAGSGILEYREDGPGEILVLGSAIAEQGGAGMSFGERRRRAGLAEVGRPTPVANLGHIFEMFPNIRSVLEALGPEHVDDVRRTRTQPRNLIERVDGEMVAADRLRASALSAAAVGFTTTWRYAAGGIPWEPESRS